MTHSCAQPSLPASLSVNHCMSTHLLDYICIVLTK